MIRKLTPLVLGLAGLVAGFTAGRAYGPELGLGPSHTASSEVEHADPTAPVVGIGQASAPDGKAEFVKMSSQFVVPVIEAGRIQSLVILSLSIETPEGQGDLVYAREPKLRDGLLQAMFDHANAGGFRGDFTGTAQMNGLRRTLLEVAQTVLSRDQVRNVLITEIVRQDA